MSDPKPPLPKERWKGPPEGIPEGVGDAGSDGPIVKAGCSATAMVIVGGPLTLLGLWPLIRALIRFDWTIGPAFWLFVLGCLAGAIGISLVRRARRGAALDDQAKASEPAQSKPDGCLTVLVLVAGVLLLLPGVCSFVFGVMSLSAPGTGGKFFLEFLEILLTGFLLGSIGAGVLWLVMVRPPFMTGLTMLAGLILLPPGCYFVALGASQVHSIRSGILYLLYLPFGVVLLASAWRRRRLNRPPTP
jgi:hypothetical protein